MFPVVVSVVICVSILKNVDLILLFESCKVDGALDWAALIFTYPMQVCISIVLFAYQRVPALTFRTRAVFLHHMLLQLVFP